MKKHNIKAPVILALLTLILFAGLEYTQLKWEDKDPAKSTRAQYSENLENNLGGAYTESTAAGTMTEEERAEMEAAAQARIDASKSEIATRAVNTRAAADALAEEKEEAEAAAQAAAEEDAMQEGDRDAEDSEDSEEFEEAEETDTEDAEDPADEDKPTEDETAVANDEDAANEEAAKAAAEEEARAQEEAEKAAAEAAKAQEEAEKAAAEAAKAQEEAEKAAAQAEKQASVSEYATEVTNIVNQYRTEAGLAPLNLSPSLCEAAEVRAAELLSSFSHTRPNGQECFSALDGLGIPYGYAGENIAAGQKSPSEVMNSWINSPGHKKNIMNPNFTNIGIACYYDASAPYSYYWVQVFTD